jgi:hypothetical protein
MRLDLRFKLVAVIAVVPTVFPSIVIPPPASQVRWSFW